MSPVLCQQEAVQVCVHKRVEAGCADHMGLEIVSLTSLVLPLCWRQWVTVKWGELMAAPHILWSANHVYTGFDH